MTYNLLSATHSAGYQLCVIGGGSLLALLMPVAPLCVLWLAFWLVDLVSGIVVSYRVRRVGFLSDKAWRSVFKLVGGLLGIALFYFMERAVFHSESLLLPRTIAGMLCMFDGISILGNFASLSNHPAFKLLQKLLKSEVRKKMGKLMDN